MRDLAMLNRINASQEWVGCLGEAHGFSSGRPGTP